jgi:hypothetical protein
LSACHLCCSSGFSTLKKATSSCIALANVLHWLQHIQKTSHVDLNFSTIYMWMRRRLGETCASKYPSNDENGAFKRIANSRKSAHYTWTIIVCSASTPSKRFLKIGNVFTPIYDIIDNVYVTSTIMQQCIAWHCTCTREFQFVLFHRKDVHRGNVASSI